MRRRWSAAAASSIVSASRCRGEDSRRRWSACFHRTTSLTPSALVSLQRPSLLGLLFATPEKSKPSKLGFYKAHCFHEAHCPINHPHVPRHPVPARNPAE